MKKLFVAIALAMPFFVAAQDYQLVWSEEFNDDVINTSVWNLEDNSRGGGNAEMQYYAPKNVTIEEHQSGAKCLVLNAQRENYKGRPATSGRINSQDKMAFQYGKLEVRVCAPNTANGLWPAFWMLGNDLVRDLGNDDSNDKLSCKQKRQGYVVWPRCGEIDMVEMGHADGIKAGKQNYLFNGACHWGENFNNGQYPNMGMFKTSEYPIQEDFHLFTLIWDKDSIRMYFDLDKYPNTEPYFKLAIAGKGKKNHPSRYFHKPFYLVANLAVGGFFTGLPSPEKYAKEIDSTCENFQKITALPADGSPAKMYIDYIRLYQKGDVGEKLIIQQ